MGNLDYLNWSARRSGLDFASFVSATVPTALPTASVSLDFDRADGFRGGIGYRFGNGWNVSWTCTYFRAENRETVTAGTAGLAADPELIATQSYLETGKTFKLPMNSVIADGALQVNIQDFEAQWSSCLNDTVGFTAFGGFRWARISQNFNMIYDYGFGVGGINLPNNMDAGGIRLGAEIEWRSTCGLRVFGRAAESVLVANFQTRQHEVDPATAVNSDVNIDVLEQHGCRRAGVRVGRGGRLCPRPLRIPCRLRDERLVQPGPGQSARPESPPGRLFHQFVLRAVTRFRTRSKRASEERSLCRYHVFFTETE